jgi:hypothetical protein
MLPKIRICKYIFLSGFVVLLFYDFHRYIFQYNFESTSPTYTNTPVSWKIGKYIILAIIALFFYLNLKYKIYFGKPFIFIYSVIGVIIVVNILNYVIYDKFNIDEFQYCFWFLLAVPYWFSKYSFKDLSINYSRLIFYSAIILYLSNIYAVANYLISGRLPALGYEGGLVRFGGFWDDPNAFGIICVFFFYYFINRKKYILSVFSVLNIFVTFSFTAYLLLIFSTGYWIFSKYNLINKKWAFISLILCILLSIVVYFNYGALLSLYSVKEESVNAHLNTSLIFNILPLMNSPLQFSENWFKSSFYNYFPISILIDIGFFILFVSLFIRARDKELKFYFFITIMCSFFFSMLYIFPINLIFIFLLADYLKRERLSIIPATLQRQS